jgi:hypothetical protein
MTGHWKCGWNSLATMLVAGLVVAWATPAAAGRGAHRSPHSTVHQHNRSHHSSPGSGGAKVSGGSGAKHGTTTAVRKK